ncbi:MAG: FAD-binding protein [Cyclobacteriaceae bacterium]|nr:FAD-binding protein [Cyclobacteriaceae bacterium]
MSKIIELQLTPEQAFDQARFQQFISERLKLSDADDRAFRLLKRSIDARSRQIVVNVVGEVVSKDEQKKLITYQRSYPAVSPAKSVIIVGAGPAGLFAALRLLESGIKPIVIERGKDVQSRRRDIAAINKEHVVNPESNYCFGEGGAGTYSDGKLYTRSTKRGDVRKILEVLVAHGAVEEILYDAHPHIGTNKLPPLIQEMRSIILQAGGEVLFNTKVTDVVVSSGVMKGVVTDSRMTLLADAVILATGHSARDIFELLHARNILIEAKPFAIGVRVEHPQQLIDQVQYHCAVDRGPYLPASSYSLVHQVPSEGKTRGVFSFCMCPGGFIVPAATAPGEVVVNGMSPSRRDSCYANSGIVVAIDLPDLKGFEKHGPLAGMYFQKEVEQRNCALAGGNQTAPAQRLVDFVNRKVSASLPETSYQPGLTSQQVCDVFPEFVSHALREGFKSFGKKMKNYLTNEAQVVGVESRTSSPVRIPRDKESLEHPHIARLFPCGEGAGYAGGIVSAAMDGERCAEAIVSKYFS